MTVGTQIPMFL